MSEEEKQAIEWLKKADWFSARLYSPTILNLISKQQKEIEELKTITREYESYECGEGNKIIIATKEYFINGFFENGYISKDKIGEKIEKIKEDEEFYREQNRMYEFDGKINLLKELLGEEE